MITPYELIVVIPDSAFIFQLKTILPAVKADPLLKPRFRLFVTVPATSV